MATRTRNAKLNMLSSFGAQIITMICGFVIPRLLIKTYGSEVYGATTSIANFLAYISLIEGGVAGVARAALYKPLAEKKYDSISLIYAEVKGFFNVIGVLFLFYTAIVASVYNYIAKNSSFEWVFTFFLVIAISISTLGQYFFGISNSVLIQADQKLYINNLLNVFTVLTNTVLIIILTGLNCNIIIVKLISSIIFLVRPIYLSIYVKCHYPINTGLKYNAKHSSSISQKWTALGQHIAYFLHSNTDIAVLTIFSELKTVAVYSVYNMIVLGLRSLCSSFYNGLESVLGDLYATKEYTKLHKIFGYYETLISVASVSLFSCASVMIIPFIRIYTKGINDTNYIIPQFGFILLLAELVYTLRIPYHYMINASSSFKQTKIASYGEAGINIIMSILLVFKYKIIGVAIATLVATLFRGVYYAVFLSKHVMQRGIRLFIKRMIINTILFLSISMIGSLLNTHLEINSYLKWVQYGTIMFLLSALITIIFNYLFYSENMKEIFKRIIK